MIVESSADIKKKASVSILDESLFTGGQKSYRLLCSVDRQFISVAVADMPANKFTGFEAFHFPKSLSDEQLAQQIGNLTQHSSILKKVDFKNVSVLFANADFTFVPSALFRKEDAEHYFHFNHQRRDGEMLYHDFIKGEDAVNIFSVPEAITLSLKNLFERFSVHHHLTALADAARYALQKQTGKSMFVHVHSESLDVIVHEDRKLLLANSFPFKTVDDAVYFVLMVCAQLNINPETATVTVAGEIEKDSALSMQLQKYIRHVPFAERIKTAAFTYGFNDLAQHFYFSAFSHILCES